MNNKLKAFFQKAVKAQMNVAGDDILISATSAPSRNAGKQITVRGVLTERSGDLQTEINGNLYNVHAHLLIPEEYADQVKIGDKVIHGDKSFLIITKVCSPNDAAVSCDLTLR